MTTTSGGLLGWFGRRKRKDESQNDGKSGSTTGGGKDSTPVVVWEARTHMEAEIVKGRLTSAGIPATFRGEVLGQIYGLTTGQLAATAVLVPGPLAEKAIELLHSEPDWAEWEEDNEDLPDNIVDGDEPN